jgi:uncharacterized cupin superfamily protein
MSVPETDVSGGMFREGPLVVQANVFEPEFDERGERKGFSWRGTQVGRHSGSERLGASLYEVDPGSSTYPYHYHLANEELLIVLRGRPHLRTSDGWRQLDEGDVVAFPVGQQGAHQVLNRTAEAVRFLIVSEMRDPEIAVYPDSDKIGVREHAPGSGREGLRSNFRADDELDYWEGETPPEGPS